MGALQTGATRAQHRTWLCVRGSGRLTSIASRVSDTVLGHYLFRGRPSAVWRFAPGLEGEAPDGSSSRYEFGLVVCGGERLTTIWACDSDGRLVSYPQCCVVLDPSQAVVLREIHSVLGDQPPATMADRIRSFDCQPVTE